MRVILCDCGFKVSEDDDDLLVTRAQEHAQSVHRMVLPAELVLALARPKHLKAIDVDPDTSHR